MNTHTEPTLDSPAIATAAAPTTKYTKSIQTPNVSIHELNYSMIDNLLETEKQNNKSEAWNKLDKTQKIQRLHAFAEKYGRENTLPIKEIKQLKMFFNDSLDKSKLQKTKDVIYNKDTREISSIPALHFNMATKHFTLRVLDNKRVSTMKSLTPKRLLVEAAQAKDAEVEVDA
jgi:hypothetical protein